MKNGFYLPVMESEPVGGTIQSKSRVVRKSERKLKIAWIECLQNNSIFSLFLIFDHSRWIIHRGPMTCRQEDRESLLYLDSHNKFMNQCWNGGKNDNGRSRCEGSGQVGSAQQCHAGSSRGKMKMRHEEEGLLIQSTYLPRRIFSFHWSTSWDIHVVVSMFNYRYPL